MFDYELGLTKLNGFVAPLLLIFTAVVLITTHYVDVWSLGYFSRIIFIFNIFGYPYIRGVRHFDGS